MGHKKYQGGFTLIEVLVTVFLLAVGILGVAGMQAVSVRESGNLYFRTQADLLINDIVDRMRANRNEARGLNSGSASGASSSYNGIDTTNVGTPSGCTNTCDEGQMATNDGEEWGQAIASSSLPGGRGTIAHLGDSLNAEGAVVGSVYRVRVFWDEDREGDTGTGCDPANDADMACSSLIIEI